MGDANGNTAERDERRRRAAALRALSEQTAVGDLRHPSPALEEARRVFGGDRDLLLAAHQRWQVTLLARLDRALEQGTGDPHDAVCAAVSEVGRVMPGLAALLQAHGDDPVLAGARRRLAAHVARACPCGRSHEPVRQDAPARRPARCLVARVGEQLVDWGRRL
ncbi:hypothetical protein [Blastococcus sp. PRF04-17]|uniref:hypothetical protein n=1 Tax=Blastococcus sp. PRF04-17 TaxID=2933797 RepID=UPI001FF26261|nr:hypothetical protein [Blastococcus sp. PRF04-17]UOY02710.1 hypothetical protein MVA48_04920 [Blastococcus sp. PRF04-17]